MTSNIPWQLLFHSTDPQWCPAPPDSLRECLSSMQLLGDPVSSDSERHYLIGPAFLQYISFMGCAPAVQFAPQEGAEFIHWYVSPCLATPRWVIDLQQALPRCPQCRGRIRHWREQVDINLVNTVSTPVSCPHCQHTHLLEQLDWRHGAGLARQFVSVMNIYPKEALPTDALLTALQHHTGTAWSYFYCQLEPIAK